MMNSAVHRRQWWKCSLIALPELATNWFHQKDLACVAVYRQKNLPITHNQSLQNHHTLPKLILSKIRHFKSTTCSKKEHKLLLYRAPHPPIINIICNFKTSTPSRSWKSKLVLLRHHTFTNSNYPKSVLSRPPHKPKVEFVDIQSFQDYHTLTNWKFSIISYFKSTTTS